jgi:hypothetical protein
MVRNSLSYVSYKDRKAVAANLKLIYTAATEAEAEQQLVAFAEKWDKQYPFCLALIAIAQSVFGLSCYKGLDRSASLPFISIEP